MTARRDFWAGLALLLAIGLFTVAPVLYVLVESFDLAPIGARYRFGLDGWLDVFTSQRTLSAIWYSLILSLRVPIAIVFAFVISWLIVRVDVPFKRFIEMSLLFGFFLPGVPMMMGWILLLDSNYGLLNLAAQKLPFVDGPISRSIPCRGSCGCSSPSPPCR
jgi:ABC-type Fe3+ transport system permease subunit